MVEVRNSAGRLLYYVEAEDVREMVRGGDAVKRTRPAAIDPEALAGAPPLPDVVYLVMTRQPRLPAWLGGTRFTFTEEVTPGVKVTTLKPANRMQFAPPAIRFNGDVMELPEYGGKLRRAK
jgi:hypothetical protein